VSKAAQCGPQAKKCEGGRATEVPRLVYFQLGGDYVEELPDRFATKRFRVRNFNSERFLYGVKHVNVVTISDQIQAIGTFGHPDSPGQLLCSGAIRRQIIAADPLRQASNVRRTISQRIRYGCGFIRPTGRFGSWAASQCITATTTPDSCRLAAPRKSVE
jgi:hypothetical protein